MSRKTTRMEAQPAQDAHSQKPPKQKRPALKVWPPADSKWPPFPAVGVDTEVFEPAEPPDDEQPDVIPFVRPAAGNEWIGLYSAFGRLIGRFLHREDALAAFVFWEQAAYAICGGEVIARRTNDRVLIAAGRVAA